MSELAHLLIQRSPQHQVAETSAYHAVAARFNRPIHTRSDASNEKIERPHGAHLGPLHKVLFMTH